MTEDDSDKVALKSGQREREWSQGRAHVGRSRLGPKHMLLFLAPACPLTLARERPRRPLSDSVALSHAHRRVKEVKQPSASHSDASDVAHRLISLSPSST